MKHRLEIASTAIEKAIEHWMHKGIARMRTAIIADKTTLWVPDTIMSIGSISGFASVRSFIMKADACSMSGTVRIAGAMKSAAHRGAMVLAVMLLITAVPLSTSKAGESKSTWYADLNLPGFAGKALTAAQLHGRPVLVQFWASWCGSCGSLLWDLDELTRGFPEVAYAVVSVDDDAAAPRAYLQRHVLFERHPQRFYFDASATLKRSFAVEAVPLIVLFDASGRELHRHAGHVNSADLQRIRNLLAQQSTSGVIDEAK